LLRVANRRAIHLPSVDHCPVLMLNACQREELNRRLRLGLRHLSNCRPNGIGQ
jgi:hypothetical protein